MISEMLTLLSLLVSNTGAISTHSVALEYDETSSSSTVDFYRIGGTSSPVKVLDCPDGYIYQQIDVYKHAYTNLSDLYLYKVDAQFVPGHVARLNSTKRDNGQDYYDYYLKKGYMHVAAYQYKGTEYGGAITYKAMAPSSSRSTTTITSTYGSSFGFEFSNSREVQANDMGKLTINSSSSSKTSLILSHSKSTSTASDDPLLSDQYANNSTTNTMEAQWSFEVKNPKQAGANTYHLTAYLLFEMSQEVSYWNRDAFETYIHYSFTGHKYYKVLFWDNEADGSEYTAADGGNYFI